MCRPLEPQLQAGAVLIELRPSHIVVTNLTVDQILVTGGTVTEIIPVPDTYDYFVWVGVIPGAAALHIALAPGER